MKSRQRKPGGSKAATRARARSAAPSPKEIAKAFGSDEPSGGAREARGAARGRATSGAAAGRRSKAAGDGGRDVKSRTEPDVAAWLRDSGHPLAGDIAKVREIILRVSPSISEGIKWNAPSFRTTEYFATVNARAKDEVQLVLHQGAKKRARQPRIELDDPAHLVRWLAPDRCLVSLGSGPRLAKNSHALEVIIRAWITQMGSK